MAIDDTTLWREVDELFRRRPGWNLQAMSRPGALPVWCLGASNQPDLAVTVDDGAIQVNVTKTDFDLTLTGIDELVAWLNEYWPGSLPEREEHDGHKRRWRPNFRWD